MNPIPVLAQVTSEHITQLIVILNIVVTAVLIPYVQALLSNQKKNVTKTENAIKEVDAKVDANTRISEDAFTAANGHNEKIVQLTSRVVESEKVVEEVKQAAEEVKQAAERVKEAVTPQ